MALHVSVKVLALGLVIVALITAFSSEREVPVPLEIAAVAVVLEEPRLVVDHLRPVLGPSPNPILTVRATAYNSLEAQTNAQPFVTATGARTRWGIVAVSRDLLETTLPYGSLVRLVDLGSYHTGRGAGAYQQLLDGAGTFIVEDTMHPRKTNQIDIWFQDYASAVNWGVRSLRVELVRYGREGPVLDGISAAAGDGFEVDPRWLAAR